MHVNTSDTSGDGWWKRANIWIFDLIALTASCAMTSNASGLHFMNSLEKLSFPSSIFWGKSFQGGFWYGANLNGYF